MTADEITQSYLQVIFSDEHSVNDSAASLLPFPSSTQPNLKLVPKGPLLPDSLPLLFFFL